MFEGLGSNLFGLHMLAHRGSDLIELLRSDSRAEQSKDALRMGRGAWSDATAAGDTEGLEREGFKGGDAEDEIEGRVGVE